MRRRRRILGRLLRLAALASVLALVAVSIEPQRITAALTPDYAVGLLAAQPFILAGIGLMAWRHGLFVSRPPPPYAVLLRAMLLSAGLNNFLPGRAAELIKATYLREHASVALGIGVGAVIAERLLDVVMLCSMAVAAGLLLIPNLGLWPWLAAVSVAAAGTLGMPWWARTGGRITRSLPQTRLLRLVGTTLDHLAGHISTGLLVRGGAVSLLAWLCLGLSYTALVSVAGSTSLEAGQYVALMLAVSVGAAVPILPAGYGTFEGAAVFALTHFGYGLEEALALALSMRLCTWLVVLPLSLVILAQTGTGMGSLAARILRPRQRRASNAAH